MKMLDFVDEFKILNRLSKFSMIFTEKRHRRPRPSPPPNVHMTFLVDKIDMWRFPNMQFFMKFPMIQVIF